ncbi:probable protein phosphatase 2C 29 isoform X2 [Triticum aestivum]|uniref:probable protein phosphatase 2C 29 isoform X2 n=1 Tax=Triticum aestivum TaxID=4565 RepID=UPI001D01F261|nr:probable protein phosphatase 2C 29 isoform X2 [Triticum aestivum]
MRGSRWCCCCFGRGGGGAGRSGSVGDDGLVWDVGLKAHASGEYSVAVAQANEALEDQAQVLVSPAATLVGVYDGHGGPDAARFVNARLFSLIQEFASQSGGISAQVIKRAFGATEEAFMGMVEKSWPSQPRLMSVGSCCLVGAIEGGTLHVANLGDSRAVLGRLASTGGKKRRAVVAERLSRDHNVADEEVRREVAEAHPDDPHIVMSSHGVWRIKGIIQVSRSIGDAYLKRPDLCSPAVMQSLCPFPLRRPVMSAVPSVTSRRLRPGDQFIIFASDGLWEQLSDEAAVGIVSRSPRKGVAMRLVRAAQLEAARKKDIKYESIAAIEKGRRRRFHDDITVVVLFLDSRCEGTPRRPRGRPDQARAALIDPPAGQSVSDVDVWFRKRASGVNFRRLLLSGTEDTGACVLCFPRRIKRIIYV